VDGLYIGVGRQVVEDDCRRPLAAGWLGSELDVWGLDWGLDWGVDGDHAPFWGGDWGSPDILILCWLLWAFGIALWLLL